MTDHRDSSAVNRELEEHVRRVRESLVAGRDEIARQRRSADETREHIDVIKNWIDETERIRRDGGAA